MIPFFCSAIRFDAGTSNHTFFLLDLENYGQGKVREFYFYLKVREKSVIFIVILAKLMKYKNDYDPNVAKIVKLSSGSLHTALGTDIKKINIGVEEIIL